MKRKYILLALACLLLMAADTAATPVMIFSAVTSSGISSASIDWAIGQPVATGITSASGKAWCYGYECVAWPEPATQTPKRIYLPLIKK